MSWLLLQIADVLVPILDLPVWVGKMVFLILINRWAEMLKLPAFRSLLSWVKADPDRQRKMVEAADAKEDFRTIASQLFP